MNHIAFDSLLGSAGFKAGWIYCRRRDQSAAACKRPTSKPVGVIETLGLTTPIVVPPLFLMEVETLGVARSLGWKVHMRCAGGLSAGNQVYAALRLSQAA